MIYGTPSPDLLTPRAAPRSLKDRLLFRNPVLAPTEQPLGRDVLIDIPCAPLQVLADDFRSFVSDAFAEPWPSTQIVIDYLADRRTITTYLRGLRDRTATAWYVQVTFSAAAGMCDTSAEVAAHWAVTWYRQRGAELASKYLVPFGFTPERVDAQPQTAWFVPLGQLAYALFYDPDDTTLPSEDGRQFELDYAVLEPFDDEDLTEEWRALDAALADVRAARKCLCQFCTPELDLSRFDRLAIVVRAGRAIGDS